MENVVKRRHVLPQFIQQRLRVDKFTAARPPVSPVRRGQPLADRALDFIDGGSEPQPR